MSNPRMDKETFTPREHPRPQLEFSETLATLQTRIKLRIHQSVMERVLDYCAYDNFSPDGEEHWIVDFPFIENDYHYGMLLGMGDNCECLEPPRVRAEMKRRIRAVAALYEPREARRTPANKRRAPRA